MKKILWLLVIFYVHSKLGNDSFSCMQATNKFTPKRTVAAAKACMRTGDQIVVLG